MSRALSMALGCYEHGAPSEREVQQAGINIQDQHECRACDLEPFIQAALGMNDTASATYLAHLQVTLQPQPYTLNPKP